MREAGRDPSEILLECRELVSRGLHQEAERIAFRLINEATNQRIISRETRRRSIAMGHLALKFSILERMIKEQGSIFDLATGFFASNIYAQYAFQSYLLRGNFAWDESHQDFVFYKMHSELTDELYTKFPQQRDDLEALDQEIADSFDVDAANAVR